jgi:hypothetical protein
MVDIGLEAFSSEWFTPLEDQGLVDDDFHRPSAVGDDIHRTSNPIVSRFSLQAMMNLSKEPEIAITLDIVSVQHRCCHRQHGFIFNFVGLYQEQDSSLSPVQSIEDVILFKV